MLQARNPFRLRASEDIEADSTFLRLFGPDMLKALPKEWRWSEPLMVRSAPGGGKTSLMRLFTPSVLRTLLRVGRSEEFTDLYNRLEELEVISADNNDVRLLGVYTSCKARYEILEDLDTDAGRKKRLLLALLNSRIVLAALRGGIRLRNASFPDDLGDIRIGGNGVTEPFEGLELPVRGTDLYEWAVEIERDICHALDSFAPLAEQDVVGHSSLFALDLLEPDGLSFGDGSLADKVTVLLDDIQYLSPAQRQIVYEAVLRRRSSTGIWLSERFEALGGSELLSQGAQGGRDYREVITLEKFWRKRRRSFRNLVENIGNRRARASSATEVNHFSGALAETLAGEGSHGRLREALADVEGRIRDVASESRMFDEWIDALESRQSKDLHERVIDWWVLEILIKRERSRSQQSLELTLNQEELQKKEDSAIRKAAELFVAREYRLPFYYGFDRLAKIASSNVEQFLEIAGREFEEIVAANLIGQEQLLSPTRQEGILQDAADEYWRQMPTKMGRGYEVESLLAGISSYCYNQTYRPTAPYAPGVTGVAITLQQRNRLVEDRNGGSKNVFENLTRILTEAIAENYLEVDVGRKAKRKQWMVLYLNRLLCMRSALPLDYGGYRRVSLEKLYDWSQGVSERKIEEPTLGLGG